MSFTQANVAFVPVFSEMGREGCLQGCALLFAEHLGSNSTSLLTELVRVKGKVLFVWRKQRHISAQGLQCSGGYGANQILSHFAAAL